MILIKMTLSREDNVHPRENGEFSIQNESPYEKAGLARRILFM